LVVVEGDEGYVAVLAELKGAGWQVTASGPARTELTCSVYVVRSRVDAEGAVFAAVRGYGVVMRVAHDPHLRDVVADLVEDLAGLGSVLYIDTATAVHLDSDTWRLVHALARGATLDSAARTLHLSTRTANRRVTAACAALGVESRAQLMRALASSARIPPALNYD
jgi:hypothetical protein